MIGVLFLCLDEFHVQLLDERKFDVVVRCGWFVPRLLTEVVLQVLGGELVSVACHDGIAHDAESGFLVATEVLAVQECVGGIVETSHLRVALLQDVFHLCAFPFVQIIAFFIDFIKHDAFKRRYRFPQTFQNGARA